MLQRVGMASAKWAGRLVPDAFVFAILLSALVLVLGLVLTPSNALQMVGHWYDGFWDLLEFSMQMVLILITGYVLAQSPPVKRGLERLAGLPNSGPQAILLIALTTLIAGFINWGIGLVVGAVLAVAVAKNAKRRGIKVHFPLAAAAGYLGLSIHSTGFSSTAPLIVNTPDHFLIDQVGIVPFSETVLTPWNLVAVAIYVVLIAFVMKAMSPPREAIKEIEAHDGEPGSETEPRHSADRRISRRDNGGAIPSEVEEGRTAEAVLVDDSTVAADEPWAQRLEQSRVVTAIIAIPAIGYIAYFFATQGFDLNINIVNFTFLTLGLVIYGRPMAYAAAVGEAVKSTGGIVLQFPLYAGILGMMSYSGLVDVIANQMVAVSNQYTFPLAAMISAGVVNFAVPSAGGQWAVQGPVLIQAGEALQVPIGVTIMAHQYGDQITNMLQPFWALPLLGITGLKARDILGYTGVVLILGFVVFGIAITVLPLVF